MSEEQPPYTTEEMNAQVEAIIKALSGGGQVNVSLALDSLAFVAAVIYDMDPSVTAPSHLRKAGELQGGAVLTYLKHLRKSFEATGIRFGEAIGGTIEVTDDIARAQTKH